MQFIYGFIVGGILTAIIGSGFVWMIMKMIATRHSAETGELFQSSLKANMIAQSRLEQQNRIADKLEEIAQNMVSGDAKVRPI